METTATRVITLDELRGAVSQAIEEKGANYVYPEFATGACVYFYKDGSNACGIGWALDKLGLKSEALVGVKTYIHETGYNPFTSNQPTATALFKIMGRDAEGAHFTARAQMWADCFQLAQDEGATWGGARDHADELIGTTE